MEADAETSLMSVKVTSFHTELTLKERSCSLRNKLLSAEQSHGRHS